MSIQPNDMNPIITRDNYEEYFLMYVDDELTLQERSMVDAFLQFHPDLQAEMDGLMGARLQPETTISFIGKENLMAASMSQNLVDESLLLHVDNELPKAESEKVMQRLEQDEAYRNQHQLLLRTKSDPAEVVLYPNKEELYRHTVYRMRFGPALRIAAALLLLASTGIVWWTQQEKETNVPAVAVNPASKVQPQRGVIKPKNITLPQGNMAQDAPEQPDFKTRTIEASQLAKVSAPRKMQKTENDGIKAAPKAEEQPQHQVQASNEQLAYSTPQVQQHSEEAAGNGTAVVSAKNNIDGVTSQPAQAYNTSEESSKASFAVLKEDEGRGGKNNLKSLLRKATRLVERRAHINATNEDDELIIGAVAIKLK